MKKPTLIIPKSRRSTSHSDLGERVAQEIADKVNSLVATIFSLYVKSKNFHWHVYGSHYREYHLLFDEQSDQLFAMVDVLAERVRKLGCTTIHSVQEIVRLSTIKEDNETNLNAKEMIRRLLDDNKILLTHMRSVHQHCSSHDDVATTSLLENFIDETERRIWFLHETLAE